MLISPDQSIAYFDFDLCSWFYVSSRRARHCRRLGIPTPWEDYVSVLRNRRDRASPTADGGDRPQVSESVLKAYPGLLEFLGATRYPDGTDRVPGSVSIFIDDTALKACLNDKDGEASAYVTADSFKGILDVLERKLQDDSLEWRSWKKGLRAKRK